MINLNSKEILTKGFDGFGTESVSNQINKWLQANDVTVIEILFHESSALVIYKENYLR